MESEVGGVEADVVVVKTHSHIGHIAFFLLSILKGTKKSYVSNVAMCFQKNYFPKSAAI